MVTRKIDNRRITPRLFENDFLEKLSHVHPATPVVIYLPVVVYCVGHTAAFTSLGAAMFPALFCGGVVCWTFVEYVVHRYLFHYEPRTKTGKQIHFLVHGIHHEYPRDPKRLVMPLTASIPLAACFYGFFVLGLGKLHAPPFFAGFMLGYLCYDTIHYIAHHYSLKKSRIASWLKQYHLIHHYQHNNHGFGVSSPLWDYIFGTVPPKPQKDARKPRSRLEFG